MKMQNSDPPGVVRIKRKRTDEPLQALLFEEAPTHKRVRKGTSSFVFKLARTEERLLSGSKAALVLNREEENRGGKSLFSIPKVKRKDIAREKGDEETKDESGPEVSPEILDMVSSYLSGEEGNGQEKPKDGMADNNGAQNTDYVYDVYYRKPIDRDWRVSDNIGYVKLSEKELEELDNNVDSKTLPNTDDEDSNSEDYYLNDYPENKDGELDDDSYEGLASDGGSNDSDNFDASSSELGDRFPDQVSDRQEMGQNLTDDDYFRTVRSEQYASDSEDEGGTEFKRHNFFPSDTDDPLAIHRDKIFDKLARMIKKQTENGS